MATKNKHITSETARWLRVGVMSLSVLGPVINGVVARLREQAQTVRQSRAITQSQEKLAAVGTTLAERGGELSHELAKRGSGLTHDIAQRGDVLYHELAKRSDVLTHELAKRSDVLTHELAKRGELVTKEVSKRGQNARTLAQNNSRWLALAGFGVGAAGTGIIAYLFIRRRIMQQAVEEEEQFVLPQNGQLNGSVYNQTNTANTASTSPVKEPLALVITDEVTREPVVLVITDEVMEDTEETTPAPIAIAPQETAFVGVASTHRYYPASTPLDTLQTPDAQLVDVVYFSTEEDAQAQGFTAA